MLQTFHRNTQTLPPQGVSLKAGKRQNYVVGSELPTSQPIQTPDEQRGLIAVDRTGEPSVTDQTLHESFLQMVQVS